MLGLLKSESRLEREAKSCSNLILFRLSDMNINFRNSNMDTIEKLFLMMFWSKSRKITTRDTLL